MDFASYTFLASGIGIIIMLSLKTIEVHTGKASILSWVSDKTNHIVRDYYMNTRRFFSYFNKRNAALLLQFLLIQAVGSIRGIYRRIDQHLAQNPHGLFSTVKEKAVLKKKGAVSFFLEHLNEEKKESLSAE
jgi:hypothetical protein